MYVVVSELYLQRPKEHKMVVWKTNLSFSYHSSVMSATSRFSATNKKFLKLPAYC